jgi:DNA recombination protein RmuC
VAEPIQVVILFLLGVTVLLLVLLIVRRPRAGGSEFSGTLQLLERGQDRIERSLRDEMSANREELSRQTHELRGELTATLKGFNDSLRQQASESAALQQNQFASFASQGSLARRASEDKLEALRSLLDARAAELKATVDARLEQIREDNTRKLAEMRRVVDEQLQGTLDKRLGDSFRLVSERLELVHKSLGEMQSLASGVGDLKRVLTNVRTRGTWGEMQLAGLLEQMLSPEQYAQNVATKPGSNERVEFALRLPGRGTDLNAVVWLPVDAKFPKEDYERLMAAAESADAAGVEEASRQLANRIQAEARNIRDKYLDPPHTTDFGILYLPTEGLYAEVLRRPGLVETVQREYRVTVAGPTTLAALLNSLQMGFRTLAIQKRTSEVWTVLASVKTEFSRFGEIMERIEKKLQEATHAVEGAAVRTRAIERKLRDVADASPPPAAVNSEAPDATPVLIPSEAGPGALG